MSWRKLGLADTMISENHLYVCMHLTHMQLLYLLHNIYNIIQTYSNCVFPSMFPEQVYMYGQIKLTTCLYTCIHNIWIVHHIDACVHIVILESKRQERMAAINQNLGSNWFKTGRYPPVWPYCTHISQLTRMFMTTVARLMIKLPVSMVTSNLLWLDHHTTYEIICFLANIQTFGGSNPLLLCRILGPWSPWSWFNRGYTQ